VIGVISLLIALTLPPLQLVHRRAKQTHCAASLQQMGLALESIRTHAELDFYPLWDDGGAPIRYTWIDVLIQTRMFGNRKGGYCPEDARPDLLNMARGTFYETRYPGKSVPGIDYSYGIGVPMSAGGWNWLPGFAGPNEDLPRYFEDHELYVAQRVLAGDAVWSTIYNLSGDAVTSGIWNKPTQFDNMVAWRHPGFAANLLLQDGHVASVTFGFTPERPVDTQKVFVWYPGEPIHVGPNHKYRENWYPNRPPVNWEDGLFEQANFPRELIPGWYSKNRLWTIYK